jgi:hypothetical protein
VPHNRKPLTPWLFVGLILPLGILAWTIPVFRGAARAADYSAHAALTKEICNQLAEFPPGQHFPASLQDLRLLYPDGGDAKLLERFEYHSTGTQCTLRTVLKWSDEGREEVIRTYPGARWPRQQGRQILDPGLPRGRLFLAGINRHPQHHGN